MQHLLTQLSAIETNLERVDEALLGLLAQPLASSLGSQIAILDASGRILAVNGNWQAFVDAHEGVQECVAGANYPVLLEQLLPDSPQLSQAIAGLRSVLAGELPHFELEWPYDPANAWGGYLTSVFRFGRSPGHGQMFIVMHVDVRRWQGRLREIALRVAEMNELVTKGKRDELKVKIDDLQNYLQQSIGPLPEVNHGFLDRPATSS